MARPLPTEVGAGSLEPEGSLSDEQRETARRRILRAARRVMSVKGLDTTVDDVAVEAGVGRRTVFRHFATRDRLLASALRDALRSYAQQLAEAREGGSDARQHDAAWLRSLLVTAHRLNAGNGRIYWELAAGADVSGELAEVATERREARRRFAARVATDAWHARGGDGPPPSWLIDAFAVHLSAFTTQALHGDFGRTPEEVADVSARVLEAALSAASRGTTAQPAG